MVGRNELCPCGSGRKYKKCCLAKDEAKEIAKNRISYATTQYEAVIKKVEEFANKEEYLDCKLKCQSDFGLDEIDSIKMYYFCDYKYDKQSTILLDYFNKNKDKLNNSETSIIESIMKSYVSIYQIKEKDINKILLRDVLLDENIYVEDINLFECFEAGNSVLARILNVGGTKILLDTTLNLSDDKVKRINQIINKRYKEVKKKFQDKKACLINNTRFMYKNIIEILEMSKKQDEIIVEDLESSTQKENIEEDIIVSENDSVKLEQIEVKQENEFEIEKQEFEEKTDIAEKEACLTDTKVYKKRVCEARIASNKVKGKRNKRLEDKLKERLEKTRKIQETNQTNNISVEYEANYNQNKVIDQEKKNSPQITNKKVKNNNIEECNVYKLLTSKVELEYRQKCIDIWKKFLEKCEGYNGNEGGWVSALEYFVRKENDENVTQEQISKKYGVSPKTLGKRYKELQGY